MANNSDWERKPIDTLDLLLDTNNYRFPPNLKGLHQPRLLNALISTYDVYAVAASIADKGFFRHELPIVVVEKGKHIVVEGNRRLAACKALLRTENLPDGQRKKFTQLAAVTDLKSIRQLFVVIAPSREDAIDLIESLHTQPGRLKWDTLAKARFDKENRSSDKAKLAEANRILDTYAVASAIPLPEEIANIVKSESKFNVTNLIRIFNDDNCKKYLGYEYDSKGNLVIKTKPAEFRTGLELIVTDVATSKSFSRLTDKSEDRKKYIDEKKKIHQLDYSGAEKISATEFINEMRKDIKVPARKGDVLPKRKSRERVAKNIIPIDFVCNIKHTRINKVFNEISELQLDKFPNATAISLRLLLEISVFEFLNSKGEIKKMKLEKTELVRKSNQQLPYQWTPELKEMLKWIADTRHDLVNGHISKKIERMIHKDSRDPVLYDLNQSVHNPEEIPDISGLKRTWTSLEALLKVILNTDGAKS